MIYFIKTQGYDAIKIGHSKDFETFKVRFGTGRVFCPFQMELLGTLDGGTEAEAEIHRRFAPHALRGEWFKAGPVEEWLSTQTLLTENQMGLVNEALTKDEFAQLNATLEKHATKRDAIIFRLIHCLHLTTGEVLRLQKFNVVPEGISMGGVVHPIPEPVNSHLQAYLKDVKNCRSSFRAEGDQLFPVSERHLRRIWDTWRPCKKGLLSLTYTPISV